LYNQGARRIIFVSGALDSLDNAERMEAFIGEGKKNNLPIQCYYGNFTEESGYDIAKAIIESGELPDAAFCANDQMAIGFIRAMKEKNLKAPDDIAIVGFDDIQVAKYMQPTLSTVGVSRFLWGSLAASHLIDFLENENSFHSYRIPTRLIQRESSTKKSDLSSTPLP
jgi:LacI family transcriptional regulator